MIRAAPALALLLAACGCAGVTDPGDGTVRVVHSLQPARVTEAQACAIGYDLARGIHARVSLRRTVIVAPRRASACERHTIGYLRRAGFRIARDGQAGAGLGIDLDRAGNGSVSAVAVIGGDLRVARLYLPTRTGVRALGPFSVQHLNPDTYAARGGGP